MLLMCWVSLAHFFPVVTTDLPPSIAKLASSALRQTNKSDFVHFSFSTSLYEKDLQTSEVGFACDWTELAGQGVDRILLD